MEKIGNGKMQKIGKIKKSEQSWKSDKEGNKIKQEIGKRRKAEKVENKKIRK